MDEFDLLVVVSDDGRGSWGGSRGGRIVERSSSSFKDEFPFLGNRDGTWFGFGEESLSCFLDFLTFDFGEEFVFG